MLSRCASFSSRSRRVRITLRKSSSAIICFSSGIRKALVCYEHLVACFYLLLEKSLCECHIPNRRDSRRIPKGDHSANVHKHCASISHRWNESDVRHTQSMLSIL